jgi:CO/xanthine dehydrogenase FAD-binding subunit
MGTRWKVVNGPGSFSKIGTRNAMVIAVAGLCLVVDAEAREVRVALGSVGPTILRATEAERFINEKLQWDDPNQPVTDEVVAEFAQLVGRAAKPIDDVRGTAAYRLHGCTVLAGRALRWALEERKAFKWL